MCIPICVSLWVGVCVCVSHTVDLLGLFPCFSFSVWLWICVSVCVSKFEPSPLFLSYDTGIEYRIVFVETDGFRFLCDQMFGVSTPVISFFSSLRLLSQIFATVSIPKVNCKIMSVYVGFPVWVYVYVFVSLLTSLCDSVYVSLCFGVFWEWYMCVINSVWVFVYHLHFSFPDTVTAS